MKRTAMYLVVVLAVSISDGASHKTCAAAWDQEPITPIPVAAEADTTRVALGEKLFHDPRLSHSNTMACATCHQLARGGGDGLPLARAADGRIPSTGVARDRNVFRVPSLRNVAVTAPYYHDGRIETLENAVDLMARRQLGMALTPEENCLIVQFLHTLTGEYRGRSLALSAKEAP